ncbi:chorismate mutase [Pseudoxanthomonas broegbernensis]|uniref:chorismate mutase n=1 Tax=Pseudoxanthomonas broegbernensis TaxID=83619 RepID=A0A7V8GNW2_9GAMM|nr:chorismate mutase [Pseudoxanthomonas broegbernensis]KAF1687330.1 chorismate mutase [Pseudoxanthomonas broegbernensis]MBB6065670.1 isochorismate pyruvate lyase [Pseudoxanthomonas broegbernensis]
MSNSANPIEACSSIEQVRSNIDRIDQHIVGLLAERGAYVKQAAAFKASTADVRAPQRVEQVVGKAVALARALGANPAVTEQVYRAMISGFIDAELAEHAVLQDAAGGVGASPKPMPFRGTT